MIDHAYVLESLIPYRLHAVSTFNFAIRLRSSWDGPKAMKVYFDGKLAIEGNSNAFTNPAIETGLVHCRALLEFLGLSLSTRGDPKIVNRSQKRTDDIGIEDFFNANGPLPMVTPDQALSHYGGGKDEAERALIAVFHSANKGLAHVTSGLIESPEQGRLLEIASRGVPAFVISHLYTPLGLLAPEYELQGRRRDDC